jgi:hypothetical protein
MLLLLVSVGGLETQAKNSEYLPQSDPGHYLSIASKMKVVQSPAILAAKHLPFVSVEVSAQPILRISPSERSEEPHFQQISLTASLRLRSPPPLTLLTSLRQ